MKEESKQPEEPKSQKAKKEAEPDTETAKASEPEESKQPEEPLNGEICQNCLNQDPSTRNMLNGEVCPACGFDKSKLRSSFGPI